MKINLSVFKDEDAKDTITYQSWCWDLTVYHCTRCWDHTLLPYTIHSLQSNLGELSEKFRDRHHPGWHTYHIGQALQQCQGPRCLEPEALPATHGWKRDKYQTGGASVKTPPGSHGIIPRMLPPDNIAKLKCDHFYSGLHKQLKAMVVYLKASTNKKTYSDYLWTAREAEKEEAMEPSHS